MTFCRNAKTDYDLDNTGLFDLTKSSDFLGLLSLKLTALLVEKVKVFRIIPEFRIMRLTLHEKSVSKCLIIPIIIASLTYFQYVLRQLMI